MIQLMMQQNINNLAQNNYNSNNRHRKKKYGKGDSWNGGGKTNSGGNSWNGGNSGGGGGGKQRPNNVKLFNNNNYCWSHEHDLPSDHNSATCNNQCPNHCTMETATDTMAGKPKHQERTLWPSASGWPELIPSECAIKMGM